MVLGPGGAGGSPSALNTPFVRDEYVARRAACMDAVSDDDDWDGVMGCTRWPVTFPPSSIRRMFEERGRIRRRRGGDRVRLHRRRGWVRGRVVVVRGAAKRR